MNSTTAGYSYPAPARGIPRKPLLALDSALYLKRLSRELNGLSDGFYSQGIRYGQARFSKGQIQGYRLGSYVDPRDPRLGRHNAWRNLDLTANPPEDAYGRTVYASRTVSR